jgi:hypothetical protein
MNMGGIQNHQEYIDDFYGASATFPTSADPATPWMVADTSSSGTPTYVRNASNAVLTLASTSEVENVCLYHGDALSFDIDELQHVELRVKVSGCTSGTIISWGMASARNDDPTAMTALALFKMTGATSTTDVTVETDDNVTDTAPVSSATSLSTTFKRFGINFCDKRDVKFFIDGVRVAASTTFSMNGYTAGLQPFIQIQKSSSANADAVTVDYVKITAKRIV